MAKSLLFGREIKTDKGKTERKNPGIQSHAAI
jgi:hypothetical protein